MFISITNGNLSENVTLRTQSLVYPSDMPSNLECLSNCPTAASVQAYFAPGSEASSPYAAGTAFNFQPTSNTVAYTLSNGLLTSGGPVTLSTSAQELQQSWPQYMGGLRSGRLFRSTDKASLACGIDQYCDHQVEALDDYYIWETGPSAWNQFAALKDGNTYVQFDAPLNVNYTVPTGTAYGPYAGRALVLQYGGFGELWGIPGRCVSAQTNQPQSCDQPQSRYVPEFVIPDTIAEGSVTKGADTYYAKWLDRELRFARKDAAQCSALTLPSTLAFLGVDELKNTAAESTSADYYIGAKPPLDANTAPRVIHGEVKF